MSRLLRDGKYVVFNNNIYYLSGKKSPNEGMLYIISENEDDIQNGFIPINVEYNKKYGFFQCKKEVPKNEIKEAYEIKTHAVYKEMTLGIIGCSEKNGTVFSTLAAPYEFPHNPTGEMLEIRNNLVEMGFHDAFHEKTGCMYIIEVDMDDPELEFVEERTEIDISKL
ncbi:MAG: hypothetical protein HDT21_05730 [Ruminococcus sp.]|nr:hypothetical protein [Ruminococcus sp.]